MTTYHARQMLREEGYLTNAMWHIDDIRLMAEEEMDIDVELTDSDYQEIRNLIERNFDAQYGINWDLIEANIQDYIETNK